MPHALAFYFELREGTFHTKVPQFAEEDYDDVDEEGNVVKNGKKSIEKPECKQQWFVSVCMLLSMIIIKCNKLNLYSKKSYKVFFPLRIKWLTLMLIIVIRQTTIPIHTRNA